MPDIEAKKNLDGKRNNPRLLIALIGFFVGLSLLLLSLVLYFAFVKRNGLSDTLCLTRDCTLTASTLISAMDPSFDPCEDFYKFSCSNFVRNNLVPPDQYQVTTFEQYRDKFNLQLKNLIEDYNPYGEPNVVERLLESYHLCLNTSEDRKKEFDALEDFVVNILDGWPMAMGTKWKTKYRNISDYLATLTRIGIMPLFYISSRVYSFNEETMSFQEISVLKVYFYELSIPTDFISDDEEEESGEESSEESAESGESEETEEEKQKRERNKTRSDQIRNPKLKALMELLQLFGNPLKFEVTADIEDIKKLHNYIHEMMPENIDPTNFTIREMNERSSLDWMKILHAKFPEETFTLDTEVVVNNPDMLKHLPELFEKFSRNVFVNFFILKWLDPDLLLSAGNSDIVKIMDDYMRETEESYKPIDRWEFCVNQMQEFYPLVLTRMFVNKFVDKNSKVIVDEMIQLIQKAYKQRISSSNWLDQSTKERALRKADAVRRFVAYPDSIFDNEKIEEAYSFALPGLKSTWFDQYIHMDHNKSREYSYPDDEMYQWDFDPLVLNAFYNPRENSIWFPSGILQLPFFDENRLAAVNFAMIGAVIGHEIGHAFDDYGSHFNENGTYEMWWTNSTREEFEKRSACFVDHYSQYCPEDLQGGVNDTEICVHGERTLGENLADYTGLNAAYDAYQLWIQKHGEEPRLPGLEMYSPEQIFFISFGYLWCENTPPDKWLERYKYDSHSPGQYRSVGALANNLRFRKAFNCQEGPMNRGEESCAIWG